MSEIPSETGLALMIGEMRIFSAKIRRLAFGREQMAYADQIELANTLNAWADQLQTWEEAAEVINSRKVIPFVPRVISRGHEPAPGFVQNPEGA